MRYICTSTNLKHPTIDFALELPGLELHFQSVRFFQLFDADSRISPILLFIIRFIIRLFFLVHLFACVLEVILKQNKG
jgi:hypothetical protein